jgi:chemotaxis protein CheD
MRHLPPQDRARAKGLPHVFLVAGRLHCSPQPTLVTTVLGSCVAVCLWDRVRGVGGINHFMLPHSTGEKTLRYGDVATDSLVRAMFDLDCRIENIEAKVFGGAIVLPTGCHDWHVGMRNAEAAVARLAAFRIPIVARRTGGHEGLSVKLFTASGDVLVRRIQSSARTPRLPSAPPNRRHVR